MNPSDPARFEDLVESWKVAATDLPSILDPDAVGWRRLAESLGSGHPPAAPKRLTGGLECETYLVILDADHLIVKVFTKDGSHAAEEFDNLNIVAEADVPTPDPLHLDDTGEWFGVPAIVMSALPGRPDLHPADIGRWVRGAAEGLAAIHDADPENARAVSVPRWQRWHPTFDNLGDQAAVVEAVLARLYERADDYPKVLSHDDYNPGNVLFNDGDLSGIVDWADVTVEPAQAAVAQYRHLLAIHPGRDSPDRFLAEYLAASSRQLADLPLWDVLYGLRGLRPVDHWVRAYDGFGVTLTVDEINARPTGWIKRALAECRI